MTTPQATSTHDINPRRFKGSLAGTLVRTLLIFTFIPLALMGGAAYLQARTLLQKQAVTQSQSLLSTQIKIIDREVTNNGAHLDNLLKNSEFTILAELALHANPKSSEFSELRNGILQEFEKLSGQENPPSFNQFLLLDPDGNVKISSNPAWEGIKIDLPILDQTLEEHHSGVFYGFSPLYKDEFVLVNAQLYKTPHGSVLGSVIGITEKRDLRALIQPLNGLSPQAVTYFILPDERLIYNDPTTGGFAPIESASQDDIKAISTELMTEKSLLPKTLETKSLKGEDAYIQVQWLPKLQASIVLEVQVSDIYGQTSSLVPFTTILALVTLLATGLALAFLIGRVIKPLHTLSDITRAFAGGDWSRRAEVISRDEIGVLASSFNQMADELESSYRSLEQKVDDSERRIRATAEMAQNITTFSDLNEAFDRTVILLVQQFGFYQASIFLMDRSGNHLEFKAGSGIATQELTQQKYIVKVNSASIVGWVGANNQPHVAPDVLEDPLYVKDELLPDTRSEASIPISIGGLVLGVLDVQSTETDAFNPESFIMLQTLSSQIATAIQTAGLTETSQVNFEELARLYRASKLIAKAATEQEILEISYQILREAPFPVIVFHVKNKKLAIFSTKEIAEKYPVLFAILPKVDEASMEEIGNYLLHGEVFAVSQSNDIPGVFRDFMQALEIDNAAFLPVRRRNELTAVLMVGGQKQSLSSTAVQPYISLADLMSISMEKAEAVQQTEKHLHEVEALASVNESIAGSSDLQDFFKQLLEKIQQIIGDHSLMIALHDEKSNVINVPFSYDEGRISAMDSFPMGEGLTSVVIRTRQPLMIVEDAEKRIADLGVKFSGKPARSWMGAPMLVQNTSVGALVMQDAANEYAFDEEDLKFFTTIAGQAAGMIHNIRLLKESQNRALQLETAAEIARDISGSLNLDELLVKAVNLIQKRFDFYHAAVFLHDLQGEYTVVREATGEIGAQMKRSGHKIGIGSKSIVGFVSSKGERHVVDNTQKDPTYYANPLFPGTRSEAAFPLRVGERILGEIDVQSTQPYAFTEDKIRSLQILADQMAIAVVNTELFSETQEHLSQHRLLHHITTTAASGTTLEDALENAVNGLQVTLGGDRVTILLTNREKNVLEIKASTGYAEDISKMEVPIGSGVTGWVAAHKRPLRVKNVADDPRYIQVSSNTRSELALPLVYRNEVLGVLNVESEMVDAYNENDEEMLGTLGGSLAAIIANARLLEQIRLQAERDRLIYDVTTKIRRSTDIQSIMSATANELTRLTGARHARIQLKPVNDVKQEDVP
ncbi:MAG: GAF domain-containing protein [Chloroflexi bacterium]|nr:GAF domain-containing protein [Chloroflexota bacterium]